MADKSKIEWTDATWNPLVGCSVASPGCDNCYAARDIHHRLANNPNPKISGPFSGLTVQPEGKPPEFNGTVRWREDQFDQPLRWSKPRMVFVNSMSDTFHPKVDAQQIARIFAVMALTGRHTFQVLTKRPQRMAALSLSDAFRSAVAYEATKIIQAATPAQAAKRFDDIDAIDRDPQWLPPWPLPNVWLGTSIEDNATAWRADHLRKCDAAVRWISAEPLIGPVDELDLTGIDWVVVGGESGPGSRLMDPRWATNLQTDCQLRREPCEIPGTPRPHSIPVDEGGGRACACEYLDPVAFFFKQAGTKLAAEWGCPDRNGIDPAGWPTLFPREYPTAVLT